MAVQLDHLLVPARNRGASAQLLARLLDVPWAEESGVGPFSPVYVNDGLTLHFDETSEPFQKLHFCFRVNEADFDAILERIERAGFEYRSAPHGPLDFQVDTHHGGRILYWAEPDGHVWELLTVSYARRTAA
jgi:catechol 2,3-dioxygenase-like lactoylglutathione lyase family enzyme